MKPHPVVVLDVVGVTPRLLPHMPRLSALARDGFAARLDTVLPAVTCSVQASLLTGLSPAGHGIVGNGWYFRELGEPLLWRQHNALVGGEKVWDAARRAAGEYRVANLCWWYAMGAATEVVVTPRPVYHADGRKSPDCYTVPGSLREELTRQHGPFPLFNYWGPTAGLASSEWIAKAAAHVLRTQAPDLTLVYLPHLDYDLQRYGPDAPEAAVAAAAVDRVAGSVIDVAHDRKATVVVLSEYGITAVRRPVDINRHLRRAGLLAVYTQAGMEYLDPWTSDAFAVADHQVAHVYVRDPSLVPKVRDLLAELPGVDQVLDDDGAGGGSRGDGGGGGKAAAGLDHPRAGELVAVAEPDAWFTYYYWLDDDRAPDFARTVEIHRKPGYDPAELFLDPADRWAKARAGAALVRKTLGFRYSMNVIPLDPSIVRGSHGRLPADPADGPVLLCSDAGRARESVKATGVKDLLLTLAGIDGGATRE